MAVSKAKKMQPIVSNKIRKDFDQVNTSSYFGLARKGLTCLDLSEIVDEGRKYTERSGWKHDRFYVKKLGSDETSGQIPKRFENGLLIEGKGALNFPKTHALVFAGSWHDIALRNGPAYVITDYIGGPTLMSEILSERLNCSEGIGTENMLKLISLYITDLRNNYIYLLDFAPRDIIVHEDIPYFVDFEEVVYSHLKNCPELIRQQEEQFMEDYSIFFSASELEKAVNNLRAKL